MSNKKPIGWRGESLRHAEASRGRKTGTKNRIKSPSYKGRNLDPKSKMRNALIKAAEECIMFGADDFWNEDRVDTLESGIKKLKRGSKLDKYESYEMKEAAEWILSDTNMEKWSESQGDALEEAYDILDSGSL